MSLFEDDFYSGGGAGWRRREIPALLSRTMRKPLVWIIAGSAFGGMLLTLIIVSILGLPLSSGGRSDFYHKRVEAATAQVRPAVVSVLSTIRDDTGESRRSAMVIGSGIIFEKKGNIARIVTNNHVVEGASSYEVVLSDGERKTATLLGSDRITDLAVLEIDGSGIRQVAIFGDSDLLNWAEPAISIGNPLGLNYSQIVTVGVISAPKVLLPSLTDGIGGVEWEMNFIQTDAAINQGNSGGALVSLDGRVVGINSMKMADWGMEGLGFAIPINDAIPIIEALVRDQKIRRPFIGVTAVELAVFSEGTEILELPQDVAKGLIVLESMGPARNAGLRTNDVIVELDGRAISTMLGLRKYLYNEKNIGDRMKITYYRDGEKQSVTLLLEEMDDRE